MMIFLSRYLQLSLLCGLLCLATMPAVAQTVIMTVNGDPITTYDIAEREKLLRALHKPASATNAQESLIEEQLKSREIAKYGINAGSDFSSVIQHYADQAHVSTDALMSRLQGARVNSDAMKRFFAAQQGFLIYARARNRALEVSEEEINAELAQRRAKAKTTLRDYKIRQVIITVNSSQGQAGVERAVRTAHDLQNRFKSCDTGVPMAQQMNDVVVRDPLNRNSDQLGEPLSAVLDKTPVGHLVGPTRDSAGLALIALCGKAESKDSSYQRDAAQQKILAGRVEKEAETYYRELRSRAVIVRN